MADSRLPDVVPATDVHPPILAVVTLNSVSNTLIRIWPEEKEEKKEPEQVLEEKGELVKHCDDCVDFVSSDSGIDSLLASPIDDPKVSTGKIQSTELCGGTHLKVPKIIKCSNVKSVAEVHPHPKVVCQDDGSLNSGESITGCHPPDKPSTIPPNKMDKSSPKKRSISMIAFITN